MPDAIPTQTSRATRAAVAASALAALAAGAAGIVLYSSDIPRKSARPAKMLLAPMIGVIEPCILLQASLPSTRTPDLGVSCTGSSGSAAQLIESTLSQLQPKVDASDPFVLGYTLPVPLLQLFRPRGTAWEIDQETVGRLVRTVRDNPRPLILYLFSTHFAANAPIEEMLAADPANLAATRDGPLPTGRYYGSKIHNWTFATTANSLTARRAEATRAVLAEICKLPAQDRSKIQGVTLLGELHHLFPDFESGMGFSAPYRVSDYGAPSVAAFRVFLRNKFGTIAQFNRVMDADYGSFDEIAPPSRDIRVEPLKSYTEHIDSFAQGRFPVAGWAYTGPEPAKPNTWIHVYRDGTFVGKTLVNMGRQDVLQAKPEFGFANTGWRLDLDFRKLAPGLHRIDVFVESPKGHLTSLGTRQIAIMDKRQETPQPSQQHTLPSSEPAAAGLQSSIDQPLPDASYYYNPLVPEWHAFRNSQVTSYLNYFDHLVGSSCLSATPRYTHQIVPFTNASWDANKFAVKDSLHNVSIRLGVSLYGESAYGSSYPNWLARSGRHLYGVTEFHPLKPMDAATLQKTLEAHASRGATFVSFFAEPRWNDHLIAREHNIFSFDPGNAMFGSDKLYQSVRQLLSQSSTSPARSQAKVSPSASVAD